MYENKVLVVLHAEAPITDLFTPDYAPTTTTTTSSSSTSSSDSGARASAATADPSTGAGVMVNASTSQVDDAAGDKRLDLDCETASSSTAAKQMHDEVTVTQPPAVCPTCHAV
jgi:hypothetical protein